MERKKPPTVMPKLEVATTEVDEEEFVDQVSFPGATINKPGAHISFPTPVPDSSEKAAKPVVFPDWISRKTEDEK